MNLSMKQTHGHREQIGGCQGEWVGEERTGRLWLADLSYYTWNG